MSTTRHVARSKKGNKRKRRKHTYLKPENFYCFTEHKRKMESIKILHIKNQYILLHKIIYYYYNFF